MFLYLKRRYIFTVLSNVFIFLTTWVILNITSANETDRIGPEDAHKFQTIALIGISIGLVFSILFHIFVKENESSNITGMQCFI